MSFHLKFASGEHMIILLMTIREKNPDLPSKSTDMLYVLNLPRKSRQLVTDSRNIHFLNLFHICFYIK
mgnify:FL=1